MEAPDVAARPDGQVSAAAVVTTRRHDRTRLRPLEVRVLPLLDGNTTLKQVAARLGAEAKEVAAAVDRIARCALLCA